MGSGYEHPQLHLAQYHLERGEGPRARRVVERCAARVVEADTPDVVRGLVLYNLACFQATHDELERARETLERALELYPGPHLREFAATDPDLAGLRIPTT
jgi:hypothetical protein